ncbi:MAG TPA: sigma-70 family RNA polymerase sigma factor [Humisphaera sp.]
MDPDDAFARMAVAEHPRLRRLAKRLARHGADADDLVQETYCRALRYRAGFVPGPRGVGPWLATILYNARRAAADRASAVVGTRGCDRGGSAEGFDVGAIPDHRPAAAPVAHGSDDLDAMVERLDARLARALADLPDVYRRPVLMWAVGGMSCGEVAAALAVPVGTVLSRLARGRAKLAERLGGLADEYGLRRAGRPRPGADAA